MLYMYVISHQSALMDITYGWARLTFFCQTALHFFVRAFYMLAPPLPPRSRLIVTNEGAAFCNVCVNSAGPPYTQ